MSVVHPSLLGIGAMLLSCEAAYPNDRALAGELLKTSIECPIAVEKTESSGVLYVHTTKNQYLGDSKNFILLEKYDGAELSAGENYGHAGSNKVSVEFGKLQGATASGSKVTIKCGAGSQCLTVRYEKTDAGHDAEWEDYTAKKSSYRITACSASSAKDVTDTINFLAQ